MNILTFDIEDWYNHDDYTQDFEWDKFEVRIYEGVEKILLALEDYNYKGTFMCLGWVAEKHPQIIKWICDAGHHLGCHSYQHQLASRFTPEQFRNDTYKAKCLLEDIGNVEVNAFRVPSFSVTKTNKWVFEVLANLGFIYDSSVFPSIHEFGGIPTFPAEPSIIVTSAGNLKEFPINLGKIFGREIVYTGGGYFRIIPYTLLRRMVCKSSYIMTYFHPSDFDPEQPQMPQLSFIRQFKNRVALKNSYLKFKRFISDFKFVDINNADKIIEWDKCKKINLTDI